MSEKRIKQTNEESIIEILDKQYQAANNKEELDYWSPLSKIILESIELRDSKQISQTDLAKEMETQQSVISRFENMGRLPNYDFVTRLSISLGHKLGMTLYGDYMAVVPIEKHDFIKNLADKEKVTTSKFVQDLLEQGIIRARIYEENPRMLYDTSIPVPFDENQNKQLKNINSYSLAFSSTSIRCERSDIAIAS